MTKLTLSNLASLENQNSAVTTINNNNAAVIAALEKTLSRDGTSPNTMSAQLDMNSQRIINLPAAVSDTEPLRRAEYTPGADATAAAASASAAASSATASASSASSAAASATAAETAQAAAETARDDALAAIPNLEFSTVTALRARTGTTSATRATVNGQLTQGDGGAEYYYDSSDTTTADDGVNTIVDADSKRWKLIKPLTVSVDNLKISTIESTKIPSNPTIIRPVGFSVVDPYASTWKRTSTPGTPKAWQKQSDDGQWWELSDHVIHPYMFANVTSSMDATDAFNKCFEYASSALPAPASLIVAPAGDYRVSGVEITGFSASQARSVRFQAYGADFAPYSGGTAGGNMFKISDCGITVITLEGMFIDHSAAHNHTNAIVVEGVSNVSLEKIYVSGGGNTGEEEITLRQGDIASGDTGCFWAVLDRVWVRNNGANNITGVSSYGQNNALTINKCRLTTGTTSGIAVMLDGPAGGGGSVANAVNIQNTAIEGCYYGVRVNVPDGDNSPYGLKILNNRFESVTTAYYVSKSGTILANAQPPIMEGNTYIGVTAALTNGTGVEMPIVFKDQVNRSGSVTIANGSSTAAVTFPSAELPSNYTIVLSNADDGTLRAISCTTNGFTVKRDGTTGALTVYWTLVPGWIMAP